MKVLLLAIGLVFIHNPEVTVIICYAAIALAIVTEVIIIAPYLPYKTKATGDGEVKLISVNVLQSNDQYQNLIALVEQQQPDILLTVETNKDWEKAMEKFEKDYPFSRKIARENTYGMHFYTKLKVIDCQVFFFLTEERPALKVEMETEDHNRFIFWGLHPPPPSPSEETTAKKKDGELMVAAKLIHDCRQPSIVAGDFNNVCWSGIARLFAKVSGLTDARIGRGLYSTFPVKPAIMRYPLDLLYHSAEVTINQMGTLDSIESDHLPFYAHFSVNSSVTEPPNEMDEALEEEANEIIQSGIREQREEDR